MEITQDSVKAWLAKYPDRDRNWLADQCGAEKGTVDNWLSTARGIPSKAILIIEGLMRADAETEPVAPIEIVNLPATCTPAQFSLYTRAYKHSECEQFKDWITTRLDAAAESELGLAALPDPETFELPFLGSVAAGEPVSATLEENVAVPRAYPPGHFVVQINGHSGEPQFMDGERWIIDGRDCFTPKKGKPCVVSDGYGSYLKKWNPKRKAFESINPAFNDVIPLADAKLQGYPVEKLD